MTDIRTKEGREARRWRCRLVNPYIPSEIKANLRSALDGLDIAEEMAEAVEALLVPCPPENHIPGDDGVCPECDVEKQARAALAEWDKWKGS